MFLRKVKVTHSAEGGTAKVCPIRWLDNFAMRNFTNDAVFDDTLPVADGVMEIGNRVPLERLRDSMEDWFRRKGYVKKDESVAVVELAPVAR